MDGSVEDGRWRRHWPWLREPLAWFSAVFVTTLLNLMDAATYGRLLFPIQTPLFARYETLGICMYLLCTATSQLVISLGSSFRKGATGCGMIENIPFYHTICLMVATRIVDETAMMATVLAAYMASALLTGLLFMGLALLRLDRLVHKFPRVVLVGSMGGIGLFLMATGLEMAAGEKLGLGTWWKLFASPITMTMWAIGTLAATIALYTELSHGGAFMTPIISLGLLASFYLLYLVQPYDMDGLRELGWLLRPPTSSMDLLDIWSHLSVDKIHWVTWLAALPTVAGAAFFGSLHVPINVPSYARISQQPFSMRRELWTQAVSNWCTALLGFIPNYFVYTNSTLFLRAGATHRAAGVLLALSTAAVLAWGLDILGYVPIVIPLFLVFYLGLSLLWEALIGSLVLCSRLEYILLLATMLSMQFFGFLPGLIIGSLMTSAIYALVVWSRIFSTPDSRVLISSQHEFIGNPALERMARTLLSRSLVITLDGFLYFANSIEQLGRLTFTTIDSKLLIIDFAPVVYMDLNFKEGLMAFLSSELLLADHTVICLNVPRGPLLLQLLTKPKVSIGYGSPLNWIRDQLGATEGGTVEQILVYDGGLQGEGVKLMVEEEPSPLPSEAINLYKSELSRLRSIEARLLDSPQCKKILLGEGESVPEAHTNDQGILILLKGSLRGGGGRQYRPGAWASASEQPLVSLQHSTLAYASTRMMEVLSEEDRKFVYSLMNEL